MAGRKTLTLKKRATPPTNQKMAVQSLKKTLLEDAHQMSLACCLVAGAPGVHAHEDACHHHGAAHPPALMSFSRVLKCEPMVAGLAWLRRDIHDPRVLTQQRYVPKLGEQQTHTGAAGVL